jgi:hypothetical protein
MNPLKAKGAALSDSHKRPVCPGCQRPMTLQLQPGGKSPRSFQCLDCQRPDPLKSPGVAGILNALHPPE